MKAKLLFGILGIVIVAIAGVSLFYYLNNHEFTIAWESPFIQEQENWQPVGDKTKDMITVGIEAGPIARECFNKSYLIEAADYIREWNADWEKDVEPNFVIKNLGDDVER